MDRPVSSSKLGLDFAKGCTDLETQVVSKGGFAVDCNDGSSHIDTFSCISVANFGWEFLKAHLYEIKPSPWVGSLPNPPSNCKIWQ